YGSCSAHLSAEFVQIISLYVSAGERRSQFPVCRTSNPSDFFGPTSRDAVRNFKPDSKFSFQGDFFCGKSAWRQFRLSPLDEAQRIQPNVFRSGFPGVQTKIEIVPAFTIEPAMRRCLRSTPNVHFPVSY